MSNDCWWLRGAWLPGLEVVGVVRVRARFHGKGRAPESGDGNEKQKAGRRAKGFGGRGATTRLERDKAFLY